MKERISTLMDGELNGDETEALLGRIKQHPETLQEWQAYHLIGDALRQPDHISKDISIALRERLRAEPTVLAPHRLVGKKISNFAMSVAASVAAFSLVVWMSVQIGSEPPAQMAMQQQSREVQRAVYSLDQGMNEYLMAHQELSPSTEVEGAATYIHTVAAKQ